MKQNFVKKYITFTPGTIVEEKNVCFSSVKLGVLGGYIVFLQCYAFVNVAIRN